MSGPSSIPEPTGEQNLANTSFGGAPGDLALGPEAQAAPPIEIEIVGPTAAAIPELESLRSPAADYQLHGENEGAGVTAQPEPVSAWTWAGRAARTIFGSTESWGCAGNTILASGTITGLALIPICGAVAVWNQFRDKYLDGGKQKSPDTADVSQGGLRGMMYDLARSPGVLRFAVASSSFISACEALFHGNVGESVALLLVASGNLALGRGLNQEYWPRTQQHRDYHPVERIWDWIGRALPARLATALANPVPAWAGASLIYTLIHVAPEQITSPWTIGPSLVGAGALIYGLLPALRSPEFQEPRGQSYVLNSGANLSLAAANFVSGNMLPTVAMLCWGMTNALRAVHHWQAGHQRPAASPGS